MPEAEVDHIYDYPRGYIEDILKSVKTIAMVGASGDKTKFSYGVSIRYVNSHSLSERNFLKIISITPQSSFSPRA